MKWLVNLFLQINKMIFEGVRKAMKIRVAMEEEPSSFADNFA